MLIMSLDQIPRPLIRPKAEEEGERKDKKEDRFEESYDIAVNKFFVDFMNRYEKQIENGDIGYVIQDLDSEIGRLINGPNVKKRGKEFAVIVAREVLACMSVYFFAYTDVKKQLLDFKKDSEAKRGIKRSLENFIESGGEADYN